MARPTGQDIDISALGSLGTYPEYETEYKIGAGETIDHGETERVREAFDLLAKTLHTNFSPAGRKNLVVSLYEQDGKLLIAGGAVL